MRRNRTIRPMLCAAILYCPPLVGTAVSAGDTAYYVDSSGGKDENEGTSARSAWKSLAKLDRLSCA